MPPIAPGNSVRRGHHASREIQILPSFVFLNVERMTVVHQVASSGNGFGRMIFIGEAIKPLAEEFPDQQTAA
ncbi:MAG: hypothetical protein WCP68_24545 [Enhydrobacter sp.]